MIFERDFDTTLPDEHDAGFFVAFDLSLSN